MRKLLFVLAFTAWCLPAQNIGGGISQGASPTTIYKTVSAAISQSATASATLQAAVTMATPGTAGAPSPGIYRVTFQLVQVSLGAGCTVAGNVLINLLYKDGLTGTSITHNQVNGRTGTDLSTAVLALSTTLLDKTTVMSTYPVLFYAQSGSVISYTVANAGNASTTCTTQPTLQVIPLLEAF